MDLAKIYSKLKKKRKPKKKKKRQDNNMANQVNLNPKGMLGGEAKRQKMLQQFLKD